MTILTVVALSTIVRELVSPGEVLRTRVRQALEAASCNIGCKLQLVRVELSSSKEKLENWESLCIGTEDVTVVASPAGTLKDLMEEMYESIRGLEQREAEAWAPRLRDVVEQILLHACGQLDFLFTEADYYKQMLTARDNGLEQLAHSMELQPAALASQADAVLTRFDEHSHLNTLEMLETEVAVVKRCITDDLRRLCPWECRFLDEYDAIKQAFPDRFK